MSDEIRIVRHALKTVCLLAIAFAGISCKHQDGREERTSRPPDGPSPAPQLAASLPPAVAWTNPPSPDERTSPGTEKFVVFVREPRPGDWNFMATVWEYVPSRPDEPMMCRVHLEPSHWSPDMLVWRQANTSPDLITLQVPYESAPFGYRMNLYGVNYRSWEVATFLRADSIGAEGTMRDRAYLSVRELQTGRRTLQVLDRSTGRLETSPKYFERVLGIGGTWIVRFEGAPHGSFALFDPESNATIREFLLSDYPQSPFVEVRQSGLTPNCRYWAVFDDVDWPNSVVWENPTPTPMTGRYLIYDTESGEPTIVPVRLIGSLGSGKAIVRTGLEWWFASDGTFRCLTATAEAGELASLLDNRPWTDFFDILTVDPVSGSTSRGPYSASDVPSAPTSPEAPSYAPEYLTLDMKRPLKSDVAEAFLKFKGLEFEFEQNVWSGTKAAFSVDGKRFFAKMTKGPEDRDFFYGDLDTKELRRAKAPSEALAKANDLEIHCVITP